MSDIAVVYTVPVPGNRFGTLIGSSGDEIRMRCPFPGAYSVAMLVIIGLCVTATGCIGGERLAVTDIMIIRFDAGGNSVWSTKIDSGKMDWATDIIETSDGGYALTGWIADDPRGTPHPRIIRLDPAGGIILDRSFDAEQDRAVALSEVSRGGFIVALDSGKIFYADNDGYPVWNRTFNHSINAMVRTDDGGFVLAGENTFKIDGNGTPEWEKAFSSTSVLPAAGGGFVVERSSLMNTFATLFRLDANGTRLWTRSVGSHETGMITSMYENPDGTLEIVYTFHDPSRDKELIQYMESEEITVGRDGSVINTSPLVAVDPLIRLPDGGYAFVAYPFTGTDGYTSFPQAYADLHLVRLSSDGSVEWEKSLDSGQWKAPQSILQTKDGGFVILVITGS
jgi:hypothetical protein